MVFIDVHSHLDFESFNSDREELLNNMKKRNIFALSNTLNRENYKYTKQLYKNAQDVVAVCPGLYPQDAETISDIDFDSYLKELQSTKNDFLAIGEVGLDKHKTSDLKLFKLQIKRFRQLIELAIKIDKPIIIHTRKAESEIIEILREYVEKCNFKKFVLHCFSGKKKFIKDICELRIYCSIPLIVLNTDSFKLLVKELPISQLLVETDSPFLNPSKQRNSPLNVPLIYKEIAKIKSLDEIEIENIIYRNYQKLIM